MNQVQARSSVVASRSLSSQTQVRTVSSQASQKAQAKPGLGTRLKEFLGMGPKPAARPVNPRDTFSQMASYDIRAPQQLTKYTSGASRSGERNLPPDPALLNFLNGPIA